MAATTRLCPCESRLTCVTELGILSWTCRPWLPHQWSVSISISRETEPGTRHGGRTSARVSPAPSTSVFMLLRSKTLTFPARVPAYTVSCMKKMVSAETLMTTRYSGAAAAHLGQVQREHRAPSVFATRHVRVHLWRGRIGRDEHLAIAAEREE